MTARPFQQYNGPRVHSLGDCVMAGSCTNSKKRNDAPYPRKLFTHVLYDHRLQTGDGYDIHDGPFAAVGDELCDLDSDFRTLIDIVRIVDILRASEPSISLQRSAQRLCCAESFKTHKLPLTSSFMNESSDTM